MSRTSRRRRFWLAGLGGFLAALIITGCQSVRFYGQAAAGEFQILARQKSIRRLIDDTNTSPALREKFQAGDHRHLLVRDHHGKLVLLEYAQRVDRVRRSDD